MVLLALKQSGLRITKARTKIIEILSNQPCPVSVPDILDKLPVNKTTVYREMESLATNGLVNEIDLGDGKKRYELSNRRHHHHLVCTKCKSIKEIILPDGLGEMEQQIARKNKFSGVRHTLEFFGVCGQCQTI